MSNGTRLAAWIRSRISEPITHLKLQKLCFYCYGGVLAFDRDAEVGPVTFFAWEHGPVNPEVWSHYRIYGSGPIEPLPLSRGNYDPKTTGILKDVLEVYGRLTAWQLRQESHLEKPWLDARREERALTDDEIRAHFKRKFRSGHVSLPANLVGATNLSIDRIPAHRYSSFAEMADAISQLA